MKQFLGKSVATHEQRILRYQELATDTAKMNLEEAKPRVDELLKDLELKIQADVIYIGRALSKIATSDHTPGVTIRKYLVDSLNALKAKLSDETKKILIYEMWQLNNSLSWKSHQLDLG